jgi:hypothetical protein
MGLKLGLTHYWKNMDWRVVESSAMRKQQDARENGIKRSFIIYTSCLILLR